MALLKRARSAGSDFFPGFTDVAEIGIGSLATVYRARETGTNRLVALKLLNVRDASPRAIESFERESLALGAVSSHPNIVTLFRSFRVADGRPVLVLELCGGAVSDRTRGAQGLPVAEAVAIGIKIAGALETAHRGGILHRDVKPQNILITDFGEPALADFGVAMLQSSTQTTAGLFDFTTLHAAPELLEGGETSAATDVYELASSLYQLVAGRSAFRAYDGESPASVILRILRDPVQPLLNANVPTQLSDLLVHAMSKDKDNRPPTAAEFAAALSAVEAAQGWPPTPFLIREPNGTPLPPAAPRPAAPPAAPRPAPPLAAPPVAVAPRPPVVIASAPRPSPPPAPAVAASEAWSEPSLTTSRNATERADERPAVRIDEEHAEEDLTPEPPPAPATPATPESSAPTEPARRRTAWLAPGAFDEEAASRSGPLPSSEPVEGEPQYPIPPAFSEPDEAQPTAVPTWSFRAPSPTQQPAIAPAFVGDFTLDPLLLRRRATIRSGACVLSVDESRLALRSWWQRSEIAWSEVLGFEARPAARESPRDGRLVALTRAGPVELPATRRPLSELRYLHALLDAYRQRAQLMAR